jgi:acylphosphatase
MSETAAVHLIVQGRVQGVFYRAKTQKKAEALALSGWVKNCSDGSVEIHAEGSKAQLEELIEWCHRGPALASVSNVDQDWIDSEGFSSFEIR